MNPLHDFDFSVLDDKEYGEDAVREDIVAPLLKALGYLPGGPSKIIRSRRLVHPFVYIGSIKRAISIIPDYVLEPEGARIWVLDAKAPRENIQTGRNPEQAFSYAMHPDVRARHYALCNGRHFMLFHVSSIGPEAVIGLDGRQQTYDALLQALAPLHRSSEAGSNFRPDLGISLLKLGYRRGTELVFHSMGMPNIAFLGEGRYTASVDIKWGAEWLATSFDFSTKAYSELLASVSSADAERIRKAVNHPPFKIHFGWDAPVINIAATLGSQIIQNVREMYLPLEVRSFQKASHPDAAASPPDG